MKGFLSEVTNVQFDGTFFRNSQLWTIFVAVDRHTLPFITETSLSSNGKYQCQHSSYQPQCISANFWIWAKTQKLIFVAKFIRKLMAIPFFEVLDRKLTDGQYYHGSFYKRWEILLVAFRVWNYPSFTSIRIPNIFLKSIRISEYPPTNVSSVFHMSLLEIIG